MQQLLALIIVANEIILSSTELASSKTPPAIRKSCRPTEPQEEGPYYLPNAPMLRNGRVCEYSGPNKFRLSIRGQVLSSDDCSTPVPAKLEIWQANEIGSYSQFGYGNKTNYNCRAMIYSDASGRFRFETTFPGHYLLSWTPVYRPAHLHFKITPFDRNFGGVFTTQIYFEKDTYLGSYVGYSTVVLPLYQRPTDRQSYDAEWLIYMKRGGNGVWSYGNYQVSTSNVPTITTTVSPAYAFKQMLVTLRQRQSKKTQFTRRQ